MHAVRFSGKEVDDADDPGGAVLWIVVEHVVAVSGSRSKPDISYLYAGAGEEDYFLVYLSPDEVMTRLGFNNGGGS